MRKFLIISLVLVLVLGLSGLALADNTINIEQRGDNVNYAYNNQSGGGGVNNFAYQEQYGLSNRLGLDQYTVGSKNYSRLYQGSAAWAPNDNIAAIYQDTPGGRNESYANQKPGGNLLYLHQVTNTGVNVEQTVQYDPGGLSNVAHIAQVQYGAGWPIWIPWKAPVTYDQVSP